MVSQDVVRSGHSVGDGNGVILAADANVCDLLQRTEIELIGMSYLQITHPDDLPANIRQIDALPSGAAPITIRKRYLRRDGSAVPAEISVSRLGNGPGVDRLVATVKWRAVAAATPRPDQLWRTARKIEALSKLRKEVLGAELFADHPMGVLLRTYVAEMEGRSTTPEQLAIDLGASPILVARWVTALTTHGLLDRAAGPAEPFQLSDSGIARIEHLLAVARSAPVD
ncbi:PAS domain-containing protein [Sphingomonas sp. CROZ-RG-20F-R02-07]|uniref:PAS domain-containing protein n=1 Tax=Sphingomonas sp. CROZ-RG-20F-R02-07 TaxID=2914832 RepID=UPI001F5A0D37|nr:PAS domain-containing protein [Sphingomonas sp. CROZ-RG-20F-R02-07]